MDDHPIVREGIAGLIAVQPDMTIAGEASNGLQAIQMFRAHRPDITLMDLPPPIVSHRDHPQRSIGIEPFEQLGA